MLAVLLSFCQCGPIAYPPVEGVRRIEISHSHTHPRGTGRYSTLDLLPRLLYRQAVIVIHR